jgi:hypothetical protein
MAENRSSRRLAARSAMTSAPAPEVDHREHLSERGVLVRNLRRIERQGSAVGHSFEFEAKLGDAWYRCRMPCGDWSMVVDGPERSVAIGFWELNQMFETS